MSEKKTVFFGDETLTPEYRVKYLETEINAKKHEMKLLEWEIRCLEAILEDVTK